LYGIATTSWKGGTPFVAPPLEPEMKTPAMMAGAGVLEEQTSER